MVRFVELKEDRNKTFNPIDTGHNLPVLRRVRLPLSEEMVLEQLWCSVFV